MIRLSDITYSNKDVTSKYLAENFKDKSLRVYGLDVPKIIQVLPTNLPIIAANELRLDNIFLLEDNSVAIIDYESDFKKENMIKYLNYIARVMERYRKDKMPLSQLRLIVIYTADVDPSEAKETFDIGCAQLRIDAAYLSKLDSADIKANLDKKVRAGEKLSDEELMQFIILPLTYKGIDAKQQSIQETVSLARQLKDEGQMVFVLSGIIVFADKVIDEDTATQVRRWISMTKVGKLFEEERIQYGKKEREDAIIICISILRQMGVAETDIQRTIMDSYSLTAEQAFAFMNAELEKRVEQKAAAS